MDNIQSKQKPAEITISTTLYRALFLLKLLTKREMSLPEIKQACTENKIIGSKISDDTIRMTISTLKSVGCVFSKPSVKNNFSYKIIKSPFTYNLSEKNIHFLAQIREELAPFVSWETLLKINSLYKKINSGMNSGENNFDLSEQSIFINVNHEILEQLKDLCLQKNFISILYSSKNVLKNIKIIPYFIRYENEYVYLWCYNEEHKNCAFLRVDRIKKINKILSSKKFIPVKKSKLTLYIHKSITDILKAKYDVKILEEKENEYLAEVEYISDFHIIQSILELSPLCKVVKPLEIKEKIIQKLEAMRKLYSE